MKACEALPPLDAISGSRISGAVPQPVEIVLTALAGDRRSAVDLAQHAADEVYAIATGSDVEALEALTIIQAFGAVEELRDMAWLQWRHPTRARRSVRVRLGHIDGLLLKAASLHMQNAAEGCDVRAPLWRSIAAWRRLVILNDN